MLNDALILSVKTDDLDSAEEIARELVRENSDRYMVRVFFYSPFQAVGSDMPAMRYEWTQAQGLVMSYDTRLAASPEEHDSALPEYEVLFKVRQAFNDRVYADIFAPNITRSTSVTERERIARAICRQEGLDDVTLYSTRDAWKANDSAFYLSAHPDALRRGLLGVLRNGSFTAGEALYP